MEISLKTIVARVRPCRCAVLINQAIPDWQSKVLSIIEWQSTFWGGADTIIIPTDGKTIDPFFWNILNIYRPDYFFRYIGSEQMQKGEYGLAIDSSLDNEIKRQLNPFYFGDKACILFIKDGDNGPRQAISVKSLMGENEEFIVYDYRLTDQPKEVQLLVRSRIGSSRTLADVDANPMFGWAKPRGCKFAELKFDVSRDMLKQIFTNKIDGSRLPFTLNSRNLSRYYIPQNRDLGNEHSDAPRVIIVYGDSLADFTAYIIIYLR